MCRRQKAVKQLLTKELEKEKLEEKRKGKRIRKEDDDSGWQRSTTKAEYSSESVSTQNNSYNKYHLFNQQVSLGAGATCDCHSESHTQLVDEFDSILG